VANWLQAGELRVGLGCMRMSPKEMRDTIPAAVAAGITVFDTARAYGDNERLLGESLRACGAQTRARVISKGGMSREGGAWIPDGRAKAIFAGCEASLAALDGVPVDTYLIHAPDPRTPWPTSVRALARLVDQDLVPRVGLSNVNRRQLDEALELTPIAAVEVALSAFDDGALRGGVVERCDELGIAVIAHSPLGGPRRARRVDPAHAELALARLLALSPVIVPIPGARRPETARSAARAAAIEIEREPIARKRRQRLREGEVVLVMGIPGAGKSRAAEELRAREYLRLNRDERGGSLKELAQALDETLASGARRVVLDNTYLTRASRSYVIEAAERHRLPARVVWLDTPLAQAQVNIVERLIERFGSLPDPEQLRALSRTEPGLLAPTSQMRALRELEPPSPDEGWAAVERVAFARASRPDAAAGGGVFVAAAAVGTPGLLEQGDPEAPHLVFDWSEGGDPDRLERAVAIVAREVAGPVEGALCPHPAGPPVCWCRPPLPGLPLAFARGHNLDSARSVVIGSGPAHRTLATALGARYLGER
jgi:aryl-alcohol dehydrogenase-like predicted oxidoreductase